MPPLRSSQEGCSFRRKADWCATVCVAEMGSGAFEKKTSGQLLDSLVLVLESILLGAGFVFFKILYYFYFGKWSNFSLRCFFRTGLKVQTVFDVSNNVNVAHGVRNCSTILRSACSSFTISHANTYYAFAPVTGTVSVPTFSHLLIPSSQSKHGGWRRLTFFLVTSIH